mmetsp:Transcript_21602/g.59275  ORF Transcript_21602/g.59275 Transcript_21602/m.59275 type:complete len:106 (-) Transcript_21602:72-389(-)
MIGTGGFATTFRMRLGLPSGGEVLLAVKHFIDLGPDKRKVQAESELLVGLVHPNVIRGLGSVATSTDLYIVMELALGGTLHDRIREGGQAWPRGGRSGVEAGPCV